MSDNILFKDGVGNPKTLATSESGGVHTPKHIVTASALPTGAATEAKQDSLLTNLGIPGESAYAGSGSKGVNGILKGIYSLTQNMAANAIGDIAEAAYAGTGTSGLNGLMKGVYGLANTVTTQLTAVQAQLANVVTDIGATNETAYSGSGSKGVNGILKGVYGILSTRINTQPSYGASGTAVVTGAMTTVGNASTTFSPVPGRPFNVTLAGTFAGGAIQIERSFDAGATWNPLTSNTVVRSFTANASEMVIESEASVGYRLYCTANATSVTYRLSQ